MRKDEALVSRVVGIKPRPIVSDGKFGDMDELLPP